MERFFKNISDAATTTTRKGKGTLKEYLSRRGQKPCIKKITFCCEFKKQLLVRTQVIFLVLFEP